VYRVKANVYVDGFNLYYGALKDRPACKWLDMDTFARQLILPGQNLNQIRYFIARVSSIHDPKTPQRQDTYLRALKTIPHLTIHEGTFKTNTVMLPLASPAAGGPRMARVLKTEEKGSDVNLATYLLLDATKSDADVAVVVSDDFDLKEPLCIARQELGVQVGIVSPRGKTWLRSAVRANFYRSVQEAMLLSCQFPSRLQDAAGTITRPAVWA
jgi:NYN domain